MGWDAWTAIGFADEEDPVRRFAALSAALAEKGRHPRALRLLVRRRRMEVGYDGFPIHEFILEEREGTIPVEDLTRLPERYGGPDFAIEGWWEVDRWWYDPKTEEMASEPYRAILTTRGPEFEWPGLRPEETDAVYDGGDSKHFSVRLRGEAARRNVELFVEELLSFTERGARWIVGLDAERDRDPSTHWLAFYRDPAGFGSGCTAAQVLEAALQCSEVAFRETSGSLLVYHRQGVDGSLAAFYRELRA
jgi:hypothetical protein